MSQVVAPLLSKIIARFLLNAENSGWRLGLEPQIPQNAEIDQPKPWSNGWSISAF